MRLKAERRRVDPGDGVGGGVRRAGRDGEAIDAIAIAEQRLELAEMEADAVLAAGDLGGVGAALGDGGDDDGVAGLTGAGRDDDAITDAEMRVGGESAVYCN
jgi:hypothetical protein